MANNPVILNGAIQGATGGLHERWLTDNQSSSYLEIRNRIVELANAIDALIPANPLLDVKNSALMQSIVQAVFSSRYLYSGNSVTAVAQSIVALFNALSGQMGDETPLSINDVWSNTTVVYTLVPINHPRGIYTLNLTSFVRTAATGNYNVLFGWTQPTFGPTTFNFGNASLATPSIASLRSTFLVASTGVAPITMTIAPVGVSGGPPVMDIICSVTQVGRF